MIADANDPLAGERLVGARRRAVEREAASLRRRVAALGERIEQLQDNERVLGARARAAAQRVRILRARALALGRELE